MVFLGGGARWRVRRALDSLGRAEGVVVVVVVEEGHNVRCRHAGLKSCREFLRSLPPHRPTRKMTDAAVRLARAIPLRGLCTRCAALARLPRAAALCAAASGTVHLRDRRAPAGAGAAKLRSRLRPELRLPGVGRSQAPSGARRRTARTRPRAPEKRGRPRSRTSTRMHSTPTSRSSLRSSPVRTCSSCRESHSLCVAQRWHTAAAPRAQRRPPRRAGAVFSC